jgi:hypothetical protein
VEQAGDLDAQAFGVEGCVATISPTWAWRSTATGRQTGAAAGPSRRQVSCGADGSRRATRARSRAASGTGAPRWTTFAVWPTTAGDSNPRIARSSAVKGIEVDGTVVAIPASSRAEFTGLAVWPRFLWGASGVPELGQLC